MEGDPLRWRSNKNLKLNNIMEENILKRLQFRVYSLEL